MHDELKKWHGTYQSYFVGFTASLLLTTLSFFLVIEKVFSGKTLIYSLVSLALIQALFQLRFFLHLGEQESSKWEKIIFYFMVVVLIIITFGSLWIMNDLNERMMTQMDMPK